ncbi:MAG: methyltransferase domain-containing protein [Proteobacteria bacterium]|nr:methyltransferase domain-containing protein [Pseudomonadota bacterium]
MSAPDPRTEALTRLFCPDCQGMLVPSMDRPGDLRAPVNCLDCGAQYGAERGAIELHGRDGRPTSRIREYPHQGKTLPFWEFYEQTLRLGAYRDTDLEDEVFALLGWLDHDPGDPILLVGAGRGELLATVAEACPDSTIVALDDSVDELRIARKRLTRQGSENCAYIACDLDRPPLRPGSFKVVLHFGVLHGLQNPLDHLRRFAPVVPPGGRVAGVALARSNLPRIAEAQQMMSAGTGLKWVPMQAFGTALMKVGWRSFRHEQPSNWMARFVAIRGGL